MQALKLMALKLLVAFGIGMFSNSSWASCTFDSGSLSINHAMPNLKNRLTVGRDVPVGTVIYRQKFYTGMTSSIFCGGTGYLITQRYYGSNTKIKANWTGQPFPNAVYQSGLPGIGFAYAWRGIPLDFDGGSVAFSNQRFIYTDMLDFDINFIKIGPVAPGQISLSSFPRAVLDAKWDTGKLNILNLTTYGVIEVVSQTCQTPDVNVDLGVNSIEPLVAGTQTETTRKGFSLRFTDCPVMYGMGDTGANAAPVWSPEGGTLRYNEIKNSMKISFTPKNGVLDSNAMIAKLDLVQPNNAPAAEGIGIALYHSNGQHYKFDGNLLDVANFEIGSQPQQIIIPLEASYTYDVSKPKTVMKPGSANAAIEFTIQYN